MVEDPYSVLEVDPDASKQEIKTAYREKVKRFHPDTSEREDAAKMFRRVKEAYDAAYPEAPEGSPESQEGDRSPERGSDPIRSTTVDGVSYEVHARYENGWMLVRPAGSEEWRLLQRLETAPYVEGDEARYLDRGGETVREPVSFGSRARAEETYRSKIRGPPSDSDQRASGGSRNRSRNRDGADRSDGENGEADSGENEEVERVTEERLDRLWSLIRPGDDVDRWAVVGGPDNDTFLDGSGRPQDEERWFVTEDLARGAYESYLETAEDIGEDRRSPFGDRSSSGRSREYGRKKRRVADSDVASRGPLIASDAVAEFVEALLAKTPSFSEILKTPWKAIAYILALPLKLPVKALYWIGFKRILGGVSVFLVGPVVLHYLRSVNLVANPFLRSLSVVDSFIYISVPALALAVALHLLENALEPHE